MLPFGNISKRIFTHTASHYAFKHTTILAIWQGRKCRPRLPPVPSMRRAKQCRNPLAVASSNQYHLLSGGERSNAAGTQAVCRRANVTRAPRSRARLIPVTTRRRLVAKPRTPHLHCAARAVLQAPSSQCRGSRGTPLAFLWGFQRGSSLRKENTPFYARPLWENP